MLRTNTPKTHYRAVVAVLAAVVLSSFTQSASAASIDLFANDPTTPANTASSLTASGTLTAAGGASGLFGAPGYTGVLTTGVGILNSVNQGFSANGASNTLSISESGVVGLFATTSATKDFGAVLAPNTTYSLTLTRTNAFTVAALSSLTFSLTNGGNNVFTNTANNGLLGAVDAVGLFGSNNTATLQFSTPNTAQTDLRLVISSNLPATVATGNITISSASITPVPEPHTVGVLLMGLTGMALLRIRRHRLRTA